ncbi:hypothetical protein V8E54_002386 [Elaphomyces granulatus]
MGCVSSSLYNRGQISDQLLELAPREPGSKDPLPLLTKTILLEALGHLSQYFADSHTEKLPSSPSEVQSIPSILAPEMLLMTSTSFNQNLVSKDYEMIRRAVQYAGEKMLDLKAECDGFENVQKYIRVVPTSPAMHQSDHLPIEWEPKRAVTPPAVETFLPTFFQSLRTAGGHKPGRKVEMLFKAKGKNDRRGSGTGWLLQPDIVVTAAHCIFDWQLSMGRACAIKAFLGYAGKSSLGNANVQVRDVARVLVPSG